MNRQSNERFLSVERKVSSLTRRVNELEATEIIKAGAAIPSAVVTAVQGTIYVRTGAAPELYVNTSVAGAPPQGTTWSVFASALPSVFGTGIAPQLAEWSGLNTITSAPMSAAFAGGVPIFNGALTANQTYTFPDLTGFVPLGAGTLSAASINNIGINQHTHAITTTADAQTVPATILAGDANGAIRLARLGVGVAAIAINGTIMLPDAGYIGNGAATARLTFDSSGATDFAYFTNCLLGVGTLIPTAPVHIEYSSNYTGIDYVNNPHGLIVRNDNVTVDTAAVIMMQAGGAVSGNDGFALRSIFRANNDVDFQIVQTLSTGATATPFHIDNSGQVGINRTVTSAQLHVDQSSTTAAFPTMILDQADLSEEFINFIATIGAGNPIDTAAVGTYYGKVRVAVNNIFKYIALYNT